MISANQFSSLFKAKDLKLSIDSSHIEAFGPDAAGSYRGKGFLLFGYNVHIEVTNTNLPLPVCQMADGDCRFRTIDWSVHRRYRYAFCGLKTV